ncbi:VOC family protein [Nocardia sp. CDC153]|uniref:VOC family protein n=1 Tax=Nocardia sp. CDC153 TaxID=3112167 RepID=UPI002DBD7702|nr:VOC family protein [Nocardia sp. CDC153]MEC3953820.1 VOC family protein [Nocardia sp. CDC153]
MNSLFFGLAVTDFAAADDWYSRLFGRAADIVVTPGTEAMWQLADTAFVYIVVDPERAGHALVNIAVPDLETAVAEIGSRGLHPGPFVLVGPDGAAGRKAPFVDPDGNSIFVIEIAGT